MNAANRRDAARQRLQDVIRSLGLNYSTEIIVTAAAEALGKAMYAELAEARRLPEVQLESSAQVGAV